MSLPDYVDLGGGQVLQQPIVAQGVEYYGFWLDADSDVLQERICDRYLNEPSGGAVSFRPLVPYVILCFCRLKAMRCKNPPDSEKGWFDEAEVAFWVPIVDERRKRMCWFLPYILVDDPYAFAMGREIYGFPKGYGWFEIPVAHDKGPLQFSADTTVLPAFSPETHAERRTLVSVRENWTEGGRPRLGQAWTGVKDAAEGFLHFIEHRHGTGSVLADFKLLLHVGDDLLHGTVRFAFLKQFRDVSNPAAACYQAIVEAPAKLTKLEAGLPLLSEFEIDVADFASHPIREDLGLGPSPLTSVGAFYTQFDMDVLDGETVWSAGSND